MRLIVLAALAIGLASTAVAAPAASPVTLPDLAP